MFCFIGVMESVNSVNTVTYIDNSHMKNPKLKVGIIIPPDDHYKPVLYSDSKAEAAFNQMNRDIYQGVKNSESLREKDRKTPISVKIILGTAAILLSIPLIKKLFHRWVF